MNRTVVAVKMLAILCFVFATNRYLGLDDRVATLIHNFDGYRGVAIFGGLWVVCLAGVLSSGFLPRLWLRVVFAVPLLAGTLIGSACEDAVRREIDYDQILTLLDGMRHVRSAALLHFGSVFGAAILTLLGAAALLFPPGPAGPGLRGGMIGTRLRALLPAVVVAHPLRRRVGVLTSVAVATLPFVVVPAVIVARGGYGVGGLPVQHKVPSLFVVAELAARLAGVERRPVDLTLDGEAPAAAHVVLVVDHGVRGDYLDLNVDRGTTPRLLRRRDRVANFGHAVSAANCSPASNLILRTGAMPADLAAGAQTNPYVWSYARRAGMRTAYLHPSGEASRRSVYMSTSEREQIDEIVSQRGETLAARERHALDTVADLLARPEPHFVMLMKSGLESPYEIRGREGSFRLPPDRERPTVSGSRSAPSYENAVTRHVDRFFEELFSRVRLDNAVLLYTSDHGQNLEGGMTDCSTGDASPVEGMVPMLAVTDHPTWRRRFGQAAERNLNRTSHFNIFATLVVLFGFDRGQVGMRFEPSLLDPTEAEYRFTTGLVTPSPRLVWGGRARLPMHFVPRDILDSGGSARGG